MPAYVGTGPGLGANGEEADEEDMDDEGSDSDSNESGSLGQIYFLLGGMVLCAKRVSSTRL